MKRIIIISGLVLIFVSGVFAQHKPFKFGFDISPNVGWLKSDESNYVNDGSEVGFSWGFKSEFFLMENYTISTGFNVVYLNGRLSYPHKEIRDEVETIGVLHRKYNLKYLEIPLSLKMKTKEFGKIRYYGEIGLGTSFLISAKGKDKFETAAGTVPGEQEDIKNEMTLGRESLILGAGIEYSLGGSTALIFGLKFDNGFTDVLKDMNTFDPEVYNSAINNYLEFKMGIIF